jgi:hypothetical protein
MWTHSLHCFLKCSVTIHAPVAERQTLEAARLACKPPSEAFDLRVVIAEIEGVLLGSIVLNVTFPSQELPRRAPASTCALACCPDLSPILTTPSAAEIFGSANLGRSVGRMMAAWALGLLIRPWLVALASAHLGGHRDHGSLVLPSLSHPDGCSLGCASPT